MKPFAPERPQAAVTVVVLATALLLVSAAGAAANGRARQDRRLPALASATEVTRASWYGPRFDGRTTASGRVFNSKALSGAHRSLPLGSEVRVTNLENGRSIVVIIDDRGPYVKGRGIDLSREAARRLGMMRNGIAKVRLEVLPSTPDLSEIPVAVRGNLPPVVGRTRALLQ